MIKLTHINIAIIKNNVKFVKNQKNMKVKLILILLLFSLLAFLGYSYIYKAHRDISTENGIQIKSTEVLLSEFKKDENKANTIYLDKVIQVEGKITQIDSVQMFFTIDGTLFASFQKKDFKNIKPHSIVKIKGRFIGYDSLLEELKIDNCVIFE